MRLLNLTLVGMLVSSAVIANDQEYRPGGSNFNSTWEVFYVLADHEPAIDDPLIKAGSAMVPYISEAIRNKDMKRRRYAIVALGCIGDSRAIPTLESILEDKTEIYYFRGDALESIYLIDSNLGKKYAVMYSKEHEYLKRSAGYINREENWFKERCGR